MSKFITHISIINMIDIALKRQGTCLSTQYINAFTKLLWKCKEGHQWEATPNNVSQGRWCPVCNKINNGNRHRLHSIDDLRKFALTKKGKCLSDSFSSVHEKKIWECEHGHQWSTSFHMVKNNGTWCRKCSNQKAGSYHVDNIENVKHIAQQRGGKCLADSYTNAYGKLLWECRKGHQWNATTHDIKSGVWCPICSQYRGERTYRNFLQHILKETFHKCRPDWLLNPDTGKRLEIDLYNEKLKLCAEFQGYQHFCMKSKYSTTLEAFQKLQKRDAYKKQKLESLGYKILYPTDKMSYTKIVSYTSEKLIEWGYITDPITINYTDFID